MIDQHFENIRKFLHAKLGMEFSEKRKEELFSKLSNAASDFSFNDTNKFIEWLLKQAMNDAQTKLLARSLTIGETYFFREKKALDYVKQVFLPELISDRKGKIQQLRIWSAGCATGEEAYTLAILLQQTLPDIKKWDITIYATDINSEYLNKARKGIYSQWSFRQTPESVKNKYFKKLGENRYQICDSIKNMVNFSFLNLVGESAPLSHAQTSNCDIILCRNVLIYFSLQSAGLVISRFYKSLNENGLLVVSPVETSIVHDSKFSPVLYGKNTFFRKLTDEKLIQKRGTSKKIPITTFKQKVFKTVAPEKPAEKKYDGNRQRSNPVYKKSAELRNNIEQSTQKQNDFAKALEKYELGDLDETEKILVHLVNKKSGNKEREYLLLAKVYAGKNKLDDSVKWCKNTIGVNKVNVEAHYLLSTIHYEQGKTEEAIQSLNNTLFLNPDFVIAHFLLGNIHLKLGNEKVGSKHFENAKKCLSKIDTNTLIDAGEGLTAGRLLSVISSIMGKGKTEDVI